MTQYTDPQGRTIIFNYSYEPTSGGFRLASAVDALQPTGQVTTFSYESTDPLTHIPQSVAYLQGLKL